MEKTYKFLVANGGRVLGKFNSLEKAIEFFIGIAGKFNNLCLYEEGE